MDTTGVDDGVELVARRFDFLEALTGEPVGKPELVEDLDHSRSTVDRAVRELEDAKLVRRETRGWVATQAGRLAAERYRTFRDVQRDIFAASDVIEAVPRAYEVPESVVTGACVETGEAGRGVVEVLAERLRSADRYRAALPAVADSRHVRLWHAQVVRAELDATVVLPEDVLDRSADEFPELMGDLAATDGFTARTADLPPFGIVVTGAEDPTATVVAYEDGDVTGFVHTDDADAVAWARGVFESVDADATPAGDRLGTSASDPAFPSLTGDRLPVALRSEGFVQLDEAYFQGREPMAPETAWRAGLGLPEVAAGYAVERRFEDGESAVERVRDLLVSGTDVALVGPPGSGKSTVCKRVAYESFETGDTVLYRESGAGQPFESVSVLERRLERASGRTVVVVEDAVRPEAAAAFETLRSVAGRDDVVFLFDARDTEWHETAKQVGDARIDAFRRRAVETVPIPSVTEADCERFVERVEAIGEVELAVSATAVYEAVAADATGPGSRVATTAFDRLARYATPLRSDEEGPSSLDEDVDAVRTGLAELGETAVDVGVTVNLLNAAGLGVSPVYAYAAVDESEYGSETVEAVSEALEWLDGRILFGRGDATTPYRTVHETWSARFLERSLADEGEVTTRRRFDRCVSGLLGLAQNPELVRSLTAAGADVDVPEPILATPGEWADATAVSLYAAGREYPKLASLFGTTDGPAVEFPAVCAEETVTECVALLGWMNVEAGAFERAEEAFESLRSREGGDEIEQLRGLAEVARHRGNADVAGELASELLDAAVASDDRREVGLARLTYARLLRHRGDCEEARVQLEDAEASFRTIEDRHGLASVEKERGHVSNAESDYAAATEAFERSLGLFRAVDDSHAVAEVLGELGVTAMLQGDHDRASDRLHRALEAAREAGDRRAKARFLEKLGNVAANEGRWDDSLAYNERAAAIARDVDLKTRLQRALSGQAKVYRIRGEIEHAAALYEEALGLAEEAGNRESQTATQVSLAALRVNDHDLTAGERLAREALSNSRAIGNRRCEVDSRYLLGWTATIRGDLETAAKHLEAALTVAGEMDAPGKRAQVLTALQMCRRRRSDLKGAVELAHRQIEIRESLGGANGHGESSLAAVALDCDEAELAVEYLQRARERFAEYGDEGLLASVLATLSMAHREAGDPDSAEACLSELGDLLGDDPGLEARYRSERAVLARERGRFDEAEAEFDRARKALARVEDPFFEADLSHDRGLLERERGNLVAARAAFRASLDLYDRIGTAHLACEVAADLAAVCEALGENAAADRVRRVERDRVAAFELPDRDALEPRTTDSGQTTPDGATVDVREDRSTGLTTGASAVDRSTCE